VPSPRRSQILDLVIDGIGRGLGEGHVLVDRVDPRTVQQLRAHRDAARVDARKLVNRPHPRLSDRAQRPSQNERLPEVEQRVHDAIDLASGRAHGADEAPAVRGDAGAT
jgi:hypothetical protein